MTPLQQAVWNVDLLLTAALNDPTACRLLTCGPAKFGYGQVACILPFMRFGEFVMGAQRLDAAPVAIKDILFNNPGSALKGIGHALIGWLIASPVITVVLAQTLKPIFTWAVQK